MIYTLSLFASLCASFIRVFQQQNVTGRHYKAMVVTYYAMAFFDVLTITLIIKGGLWIAFSAGTGASIGGISALLLHRKVFK